MLSFGKLFFYIFNSVIVIAPFVLLILPADFFDAGESLCLSKQLAGIECPACGMTRGIMHLIHFDFEKAWLYNKMSFIVTPLLIPLWLKALFLLLGFKLPRFLDKLM